MKAQEFGGKHELWETMKPLKIQKKKIVFACLGRGRDATPRTDPYLKHYFIRLLPWV